MATASVERGMLWTDLEGRELPGGWRLKRLLRPEGRNAWFEAAGPDGQQAIVSLTEALNDEDELLARLRAAAAMHHPNVVAVRDARLAWLDETPMVMAAMEPTDENLAEVLRERALDPAEARVVLQALLQGLAAIHARRLTHGRLEAGSVLAMGETVKLRSDCLHLEGAGSEAEDVRGLGRVVTQALTRRIPAGENDPVLQLVPEPMGRAVRRALSGTATVAEVASLAGVRLAKSTEAPARNPETKPGAVSAVAEIRKRQDAEQKIGKTAAAEAQKPELVTAMQPAEGTAAPKSATAQIDLPLIPRRREVAEAQEEDEDELASHEVLVEKVLDRIRELPGKWKYHRRGAPWVIAAAVGLILATALMLHGWLHRGRTAKVVAANPRVVVERAGPAKPAMAKAAASTRVWHVVAYTYRRQSEAEQRAHDLAQRYPTLAPGVMATRGGDFLVTLGGPMGRERAMALRGKAVRMGLPWDTYAQNFR
jgi:eukaryotic-like serine/threonine-protein kinase